MTENTTTEKTEQIEPRLRKRYEEDIVPELMDILGIDNKLGVPKLKKISLNIGFGNTKGNDSIIEESLKVLQTVTGQKGVITKARKSVAGFGIRVGDPVGCKVTLRSSRMYEFLDRLISIVLPRIRDFRGLSPNAFDGDGNYSLGLEEYFVFPEVNPDELSNLFGMDVTICTTASDDRGAYELLRLLGMPFRKQ
jgi:large subunit ribosomal protein L5